MRFKTVYSIILIVFIIFNLLSSLLLETTPNPIFDVVFALLFIASILFENKIKGVTYIQILLLASFHLVTQLHWSMPIYLIVLIRTLMDTEGIVKSVLVSLLFSSIYTFIRFNYSGPTPYQQMVALSDYLSTLVLAILIHYIKNTIKEKHVLTALIENNPDLVFSLDLKGNILNVNPEMEKTIGYNKDEMLNRPVSDFIEKQDIRRSILYFKRVIKQGKSYNFDVSLIHKRGYPVEVRAKIFPVKVHDKLVGVYALVSRTEKELINTQLEFADTIRLQQGMTFKFKKINGRYVHTLCDGGLMYKLGFSSEQIVGNDLFDLFSEKYAMKKSQYYERAWEGEENVAYEGEHNGVTYLAVLKPIRKKGKVTEVIGSCVDITDRKKAEKSLKEAEIKYRSLVEESLVGVYITQNGNYVYVNPRFADIFGYSQMEMIGTSPLDYIVPEEREFVADIIRRRLNGEYINPFELKGIRKDNSIIHLEVHGAVTIYNGEPATTGTIVDITERKKNEELEQISAKLSAAGQLAAGVAHEIRNPLTSLNGFLKIMQSKTVEYKEYFDIMLSEIKRINLIVSEFLLLARNPMSMKFEQKDPLVILHHVLTLLETQANMNNVLLTTDFAPDIPKIWCEENQLKQVFINVIKNAIEAMPDGGEINITAKMANNHQLSIRVIDQGNGISEEQMAKIGEPFYTTKEEGTGLGLMVSYKIIETHKGKINISSCPGEGTTVEILLSVNSTKDKGS